MKEESKLFPIAKDIVETATQRSTQIAGSSKQN